MLTMIQKRSSAQHVSVLRDAAELPHRPGGPAWRPQCAAALRAGGVERTPAWRTGPAARAHAVRTTGAPGGAHVRRTHVLFPVRRLGNRCARCVAAVRAPCAVAALANCQKTNYLSEVLRACAQGSQQLEGAVRRYGA